MAVRGRALTNPLGCLGLQGKSLTQIRLMACTAELKAVMIDPHFNNQLYPGRCGPSGCHGVCLFLDGVSSPLIFSLLTLLPESQISAVEAMNCPSSKLG